MIYHFQWVRRAIGGKWGHATGWFFGKRWVRLSKEAVQWTEFWVNAPEGTCEGCGCKENSALLWGGHRKDCKWAIPF